MQEETDQELEEMAIAFGDPERFESMKKQIKQQTEENKKFYPKPKSPLAELADEGTVEE